MTIVPFRSLLKNYKAIFLDSYGVLKNHNGIIPGADETIRLIQLMGLELYILTNDASRSPKLLAEKFNDQGLKDIDASHIISSGMMAMEYLRLKIKSGRIVYLGTEDSAHYIEEVGLKTVSISDLDLKNLDDISAMVFLDDEGFDWNKDITKAVNLLRKKNVPAIVANSDLTYPVSKTRVAVATGGIADLVQSIVGKRFIHFGKPDGRMFMYAYELLQEVGEYEKNEILMVGDTLQTDIIGGNKFGADTALVLSGNTTESRAERLMDQHGIRPDFICESIGS